ncbi:uncharacterized protein K489DRAFT_433973 [Dissoconium aciculare CBS 342.82]|uniref:Uncharacterized protein n=1 Tax=Dissoconium aciculare CBS 342.82 TaxID=1314786 RepID=A0A6J3LX21_9PEZI|nr:uncharacterized protein K489DRAFT_433973 [Dissoconium aciculare CBS 342.82]KAF1819854.1 hypothetical protein K489DRAFT_433973 [Dissoconium aciculare CBS 342.82]
MVLQPRGQKIHSIQGAVPTMSEASGSTQQTQCNGLWQPKIVLSSGDSKQSLTTQGSYGQGALWSGGKQQQSASKTTSDKHSQYAESHADAAHAKRNDPLH